MQITELLGPEGPLAEHISGFTVRPQQQQMAEAVAEVLHENGEHEATFAEFQTCRGGWFTGKPYVCVSDYTKGIGRIIVRTQRAKNYVCL